MDFIGNLLGIRRERGTRAAFLNDLRKGDILISSPMSEASLKSTVGQMIGHAAIMATDDWIVEMPGESNSSSSSFSFSSSSTSTSSSGRSGRGNNRRISKNDWFDDHLKDNINVYRCRNRNIAEMAADWAYTHYYNSSGGERKNIHVKYSIVSPIFNVRDPSYCSKLVLQSYYYGTGSAAVLWPTIEIPAPVAIVPTTIPSYFTPLYSLSHVGLY